MKAGGEGKEQFQHNHYPNTCIPKTTPNNPDPQTVEISTGSSYTLYVRCALYPTNLFVRIKNYQRSKYPPIPCQHKKRVCLNSHHIKVQPRPVMLYAVIVPIC